MNSVTAIVETPKGSALKYDYYKESHFFKLKKIMPAGMVFPFDFGFIPGTIGEDGDPLDIIIISEIISFPGCSMDCRLIGGIKAEQTEKDGKTVRNDRLIGIPEVSQLLANIKAMADLPENIMIQLEEFFKNYNEQAGKKFIPLDRITAEEAMKIVSESPEL